MANQPIDIVALINHKVVRLYAEDTIFPHESKGGVVSIESTLEIPDDIKELRPNDKFSILLTLECRASDGVSEKTAFTASCKVEGTFVVVKCAHEEINPVANFIFWNTAASQLTPLLSSYISEQITRMGFKNIQIPPFIPVAAQEANKTVTKTQPAKAKQSKKQTN